MAKILSVLVVAAWLGMTALLVARHDAPAEAPPAAPTAGAAVREQDSWMGIYLEGRKVGYAHSTVDRTPGGYALVEEMDTTLTVQGTKQRIKLRTDSELDDGLSLKTFLFRLESGAVSMSITGEARPGMVVLDVDTAGRKRRVELPFDEPPHMSADVELLLRRGGLSVGKKYNLPFFDPSTMSKERMLMEVEAVEQLKLGGALVPVYRVRQEYAGIKATAWISPEEGTVKAEGPMGFTFMKETREQATRPPAGGYSSVDIIALASVQVKGRVDDPRRTARLKARLTGAELAGLDIDGGRQAFNDGVVTVSVEELPGTGADMPVADPSLAGYLKPDALVQSDDPGIRAKASELTGGEKDALVAARLIADWVHRSVRKATVAGLPSAVEVLEGLRGDCNEHTVLYTALARSVGIPTRMAAGLVMMDGRFYYHAWPEVYVGRWVAIDPTFGQFPADATHIRLVEGGPDRQIAILKLVGKLKIEILEHD